MLRAIIFDFDGVLANSEPLHLRSYQAVLSAERITLDEADYYARYLGYDDVGAFRAIARDHQRAWSPEQVGDLVAAKARRMEELERDISVLYPGAADAVRRVSTVPLAIASGALGIEIRRVLDREGLAPFFPIVVSAEDTPASKPSPDPYLRALGLLGEAAGHAIDPRDCVAIEDSLWGLESARAAGLRTVAVAQTYTSATLAPAADLVLSSVADVDLHTLAALFHTS